MKTKVAEIRQVLLKTAEVMRAQNKELEYLRQKQAAMERREGARKLAQAAQERGFDTDVPLERLAADLEKRAQRDPDGYTGYAHMVRGFAEHMGNHKYATIRNNDERSSIGSSDLERLIAGQMD